MGLAAAELDKKMSNIRPDIKFENEDDKKLLANIATMDASSGEYKVSISDREGHVEQVRLSDLTQEQTKLLVEQQKNAPKDMEGIARSQLTLTEQINGDISAIKSKVTMGVASTDQFKSVSIAAKEISSNFLGSIEKVVAPTSVVRGEMTTFVSNVGKLMESFGSGGKNKEETLKALDGFKTQFASYGGKIGEAVTKAVNEMKSNVNNTKVNLTDKLYQAVDLKDAKSKYDADLRKQQVDVSGKVNVDFTSSTNAFAGLTKNQIEELMKSPKFQEALTKIVKEKWSEMHLKKQ